MGLLAIIKREPKITMAEWKRVILATEALVLPKPREIENPFRRGTKVVVNGPEGRALIALEGPPLGPLIQGGPLKSMASFAFTPVPKQPKRSVSSRGG